MDLPCGIFPFVFTPHLPSQGGGALRQPPLRYLLPPAIYIYIYICMYVCIYIIYILYIYTLFTSPFPSQGGGAFRRSPLRYLPPPAGGVLAGHRLRPRLAQQAEDPPQGKPALPCAQVHLNRHPTIRIPLLLRSLVLTKLTIIVRIPPPAQHAEDQPQGKPALPCA